MRVRGGLAAVVLVATALAMALRAEPAPSAAPPGFCTGASKYARTILKNREARVYSVPFSAKRPKGRQEVHACLYATDRDEAIDDGDFFLAFHPPGMSLRGHRLAYGLNVADEGDEPARTYIQVINLRRPDRFSGSGFDLMGAGSAGPGDTAKIGSLALGAHGTIAWISCPADPFDPLTRRSLRPRPGCVRPGHRDQVRTLVGFNHVRVLARGRKIDPASLRVHGTRASWISGGRRHSARLPWR